jgi:hypothetical protein
MFSLNSTKKTKSEREREKERKEKRERAKMTMEKVFHVISMAYTHKHKIEFL